MTEKYGAPTTLQSQELTNKVKATCLEKYGYENPSQSNLIQEKRKATCLEKYGYENPMKSSEIAQKSADGRSKNMDIIIDHIKQSMMNTYGVDNAFKSEEVKSKIVQSLQIKYGVSHPMHSPEIKKKLENTCNERYGHPYYVLTEKYRSHKYFKVSKINQSFAEKLKNIGVEYVPEYSIGRKSYDFLIPTRNLLIEINPTYTHMSYKSHWCPKGQPKTYHLDRTNLANMNSLNCLHIWDWNNQDMMIQKFLPQKIINACELKIYKLNIETCNQFLQENDYLPIPRGQILCLGLVKDDKIYQVMTFCKSKYQKQYIYQISRICTLLNYEVIGGFDLLSSEASRMFEITSCIAYADISKYWQDEVYQKIGMKLQKQNPPNLIWSKGSLYKWDYLIKGTKEERYEKMIESGWMPIYDCGTNVYVFG